MEPTRVLRRFVTVSATVFDVYISYFILFLWPLCSGTSIEQRKCAVGLAGSAISETRSGSPEDLCLG